MATLNLGNVKGPQGIQGVGVKNIAFKTQNEKGDYIYLINLTDGNSFELISPRGPQGIQGETGPVGPMPDTSAFQTKEDLRLNTETKKVVDAINEILENSNTTHEAFKKQIEAIQNYLKLEPREDTLGNGYLGAFYLG